MKVRVESQRRGGVTPISHTVDGVQDVAPVYIGDFSMTPNRNNLTFHARPHVPSGAVLGLVSLHPFCEHAREVGGGLWPARIATSTNRVSGGAPCVMCLRRAHCRVHVQGH